MLGPIEKNVKMSQKVVEQVQRLITEGQLQPGQRLPTEKDLAEMLQISRPTLREALTVLEAMGHIEIRPREGSFVRTLIPSQLGDSVVALLTRHPEKIFELLEVKRTIDPEGAAMAATRAGERDVAQLQEYLERAKVLVASGRSIFSPDVADIYAKTLLRIAEATHNSVYAYVMRMLWTMVEGALPYSREKLAFAPRIFPQLFQQYVAIVEAVIGREPAKARRAMRRHLEFGEQALRRVLAGEGTAAPAGGGTNDASGTWGGLAASGGALRRDVET